MQTDHQPLKWLHTKCLGKDLNPRLQRWILSLGEYKIKLEYLKGKDNKLADFLSRINTDTHEINLFNLFEINNTETDENDSLNNSNDNQSVEDTVHSQEENLNDHIILQETIINRFKMQIIITDVFNNEFEEILGNRRIYVSPNLNSQNFINKIKQYLNGNRVGIYTQISDAEFNLIQQLLIREFPSIKFTKCMFFAQDITSEDELHKIIAVKHKELKHPGIIPLYEHLKYLIYNKKLKNYYQ